MVPPPGLAPGLLHNRPRMVGHQGCGYPVTSARQRLRGKLADATGYPHPAPHGRSKITWGDEAVW